MPRRAGTIPSMPWGLPVMPGMETVTLHIMVPKSRLYDESISLTDLHAENAFTATEGLRTTLMHKRCQAHGHLHPQTEALRNGGDWTDIPDEHPHPAPAE